MQGKLGEPLNQGEFKAGSPQLTARIIAANAAGINPEIYPEGQQTPFDNIVRSGHVGLVVHRGTAEQMQLYRKIQRLLYTTESELAGYNYTAER